MRTNSNAEDRKTEKLFAKAARAALLPLLALLAFSQAACGSRAAKMEELMGAFQFGMTVAEAKKASPALEEAPSGALPGLDEATLEDAQSVVFGKSGRLRCYFANGALGSVEFQFEPNEGNNGLATKKAVLEWMDGLAKSAPKEFKPFEPMNLQSDYWQKQDLITLSDGATYFGILCDGSEKGDDKLPDSVTVTVFVQDSAKK